MLQTALWAKNRFIESQPLFSVSQAVLVSCIAYWLVLIGNGHSPWVDGWMGKDGYCRVVWWKSTFTVLTQIFTIILLVALIDTSLVEYLWIHLEKKMSTYLWIISLMLLFGSSPGSGPADICRKLKEFPITSNLCCCIACLLQF